MYLHTNRAINIAKYIGVTYHFNITECGILQLWWQFILQQFQSSKQLQ